MTTWSGRLALILTVAATLGVVAVRGARAREAPPAATAPVRVGDAREGGVVVPTEQIIRPAGASVAFAGRPVDLAVAPDGRTVYAKDNRGLVVIDADRWVVRQELSFPSGGGSMHGIVVSADGRRVFATGAGSSLFEGLVGDDGRVKWGRSIAMPGPVKGEEDDPAEQGRAVTALPTTKPANEAPKGKPADAPPTTKAGSKDDDDGDDAPAKPVPKAKASRKASAVAAGRRPSFPCGVALSHDERTAYVCLSISNALAVVDLEAGKLVAEIPVGVAPFAVAVAPGGKRAYVTNWGGRRAKAGDRTAKSAGTDTVIDERGIAATGTVGIVDLDARRQVAEVALGLHPSGLALTRDGGTLYVANANSDTVSVVDTAAPRVRETIVVRPDAALPFGSAVNAVALSADERTLYAAAAGNNAVAVVELAGAGGRDGASRVAGFIPAGWHPGAVARAGDRLFVANVKGVGSRGSAKAKTAGRNSRDYLGTVTRVDRPDAATLARYTAQVLADARVPEALAAFERAPGGAGDAAPVPVPAHPGEPSTIEHVVYVIKENRTYDQVLGDVKAGNGDAALCVFGQRVTPNHHALAEQFVLLDNFYCNGVLSADGHQWAVEGHVVDGLEKSFGGFARSYPFGGDDPLAVASTGYLWDNALLRGRSFRNFGEMTTSKPVPAKATFEQIYEDHLRKTGQVRFSQTTPVDELRPYTQPDYPGWNLTIPDAVRVEVFLKELKKFEQAGGMPNLMIVYLPNDHTHGTTPGAPTPAAMVADNDLALGRLVEALSRSAFWPTTCLFAIEDDPQNGFDHVDGHRSLCIVASPYAKRGAVVSQFYNQTSVLHTMELMLGLPPMNQGDAMAPVMRECFTTTPDVRPFAALPNQVPLDQMNPALKALGGPSLHWAEASLEQRMDLPDMADEDTLNRVLWFATKGENVPYPVALAGAHGKGLGKLGLKLDGRKDADDDD